MFLLEFRHHLQQLLTQANRVALLHEHHLAVGVGDEEDGADVGVEVHAFNDFVAGGAIVDAKDDATILTGHSGGRQVRCIKNRFTRGYWRLYNSGASSAALEGFCTGSIGRAKNGDVLNGAVSAGMIAPMISECKPVWQIVHDIMTELDAAYKEMKEMYG